MPLETRGQIAEWDAAKKRLTVFGATKVLFFNRRTLAPMLGVTEADIDMIEVDVGGGFGVRASSIRRISSFRSRRGSPAGR